MIWVVIRKQLGRPTLVNGPFASAARAAGYGFMTYGAIEIGNRWTIHEVTR